MLDLEMDLQKHKRPHVLCSLFPPAAAANKYYLLVQYI